jgi:environmental stress-induced protein Ves
MIRFLKADERRPVPWKNGGGTTHEVVVFPEHAGIDDFLVRVSIAEVSARGPFSIFEGIDRTLAVLSGSLRLDFADGNRVTLWPSDSAYSFAGDRPVTGIPVNGTVRDLNVMTRRGKCFASMTRMSSGQHVISADGEAMTIVVTAGDAVVETSQGSYVMTALDALLVCDLADVEDAAGATLRLTSTARSFLIRVGPATEIGRRIFSHS